MWLAGKRAFQAEGKYKGQRPEPAWHIHLETREEATEARGA